KMLDKTSSIICAFGLAAAAPRSPYRHLELCGIALGIAVFYIGFFQKPDAKQLSEIGTTNRESEVLCTAIVYREVIVAARCVQQA
ncbi:MAG: hypothetical protein KHX60_14955, partial [Subdoligranulum variabile]|nr:hypothetical protein [Subdoligranulum variabile]